MAFLGAARVEVMNAAWADSLLASYKADAEGPERASLPEAALGELVAAWDRGQAANDTAMGRFLTWVCPTAGGGAQDAGKALRSRKRAKSTAKTANRAPTPYASRPTAAVRKTTGLKRRAEQANKELRGLERQLFTPPAESAEVSSLATVADARLG
jgi:hypothetical protein